MKPAFSEKAIMFSVGAVRIEIVGTAASARIDTNDVSGFCFTHTH